MKQQCKIEGCERPVHGNGMCNKHYLRSWRGKDPSYISIFDPLDQRFEDFLPAADPVTGCIEWTGRRDAKGYGAIGREGQKAHRLAYEKKNGPIPDGMCVCHHCDNPPCCNPDHLFLGTNADNNNDRHLKGRTAKGEHVGSSKLKSMDIPEIRRRLAAGDSQAEIASDYGVDQKTISCVKTGRQWSHI